MKNAHLFILLLIAVFGTACQTRQDRVAEFAREFNAVSGQLVQENQQLRAAWAKVKSDHEIDIVLDVKVDTTTIVHKMMSNLLPSLMGLLVVENPDGMALLKEGVTFNGYMRNHKNRKILNQVAVNGSNYSDFTLPQNGASALGNPLASNEDQLDAMIAMINQSLPVEDKENDLVITKTSLENGNTLVYHCVVGELYKDVYKLPAAAKIFKEAALTNPTVKEGFLNFKGTSLNKISYLYIDANEKVLLRVDLTEAELMGQ